MNPPNELPRTFGRYILLRLLGRGGMGTVYLAQDPMLARHVALKMPNSDILRSPNALERFLREARSAARLNHRNICQVFDVGSFEEQHFLTMAYIEGEPLSRLIETLGAQPRRIAELIRVLALALDEAHRQGIIHRDLKPANITIDRRGEPVIMDFGLAREIQAESNDLSTPGMAVGTPAYMAPEQALGDPTALGPGCDVYSLGVIFYELLTGRVPFAGPTAAVFWQILHQPPRRPSELRPGLDPRLEAICLRALAKKPADRFASMADFAVALQDYIEQPASPQAVESHPSLFRRMWNWLRSGLSRPDPQPQPEPVPLDDRPTPDPGYSAPIVTPAPDSKPVHRPTEALPRPIPSVPVVRAQTPDPDLFESGSTLSVTVVPPSAPSLPPQKPPPSPAANPLFDRPFGKYQLLRKLGQGETGIVYLARHAEQNWQTALKVLPGARFTTPACVQRLLREARVGAGLRHPNLCQILDAGTEQGEFYLAMEYLEGQTLRGQIEATKEGLAVPLACYHAHQLFDALAYLARHEVVHRDIKPGNVMVCAGDRLKLMDLGLAKVPDPEQARLTMTGIILGTPAYMAPEQILDASRATARSDLYAAGATLFEMLTGTRPFLGDSPVALMHKVVNEPPPDPRSRRPDLPEPLARIILQLLDKEPERRPNHDEVLAVLRTVCQGLTPLMPEAPVQRSADPVVVSGILNVSMVARIDQAAKQINNQDVDDLLGLLPTEEGKIRLGNYYLEERIGPQSAVNTYRARHFLAGHPFIVRLLPLALSQMAPERLRGLLGQRAQLMQISMQSPYLSRLLDIGKTQLREGTFDTLYYTVEDFLPGSALEGLITTPALAADDVEKCLTGAARGLLALHKNGTLHGNLHPGKLFFDGENSLLRIADLSHARPLQPATEAVAQPAVQSAINDLDWLGDGLTRRRQYVAPEIICDGEAPGLLTEQYALGVIFVEVLSHRFLRTHQNDLKLMLCVQQDLQDCLFEIAETVPGLGRVLRRMVAINPKARYPDLAAVLKELSQPEQTGKRRDGPRKKRAAAPPRVPYDVFVSYRRSTGSETARLIVGRLEQKGMRAFLDVDSLDSGRFDDRLLLTIENTPNFVVILSEGSLDRCMEEGDWLRREIGHAIESDRNIIPILMPQFQMPEALPEEMETLPTFNGVNYQHEYFDGCFEKLLKFLKVRA